VLEAEVDLATKSIAAFNERKGVEAPITLNEFSNGVNAALEHPPFLEALKKRGFTDAKKLYCAPFTMGNYAIKAHEGKRLLKVGCFDTARSTTSLFGSPIEKLYALVELREKRVLQVVDYGVVPVVTHDMNFTEAAAGTLRAPEKAVLIQSPKGANFSVKGGEVAWGNWRFHVRLESRQGPVISLARWVDKGAERSVLYQGYMSEMFVPYMDPEYGWYSRTYFDMGEYGLGLLASPLKPGVDCPANATFLEATLNDDQGEPDKRPNAICIFERNAGDPIWRHYELTNQSYEGRPGVELVVRSASQLGNYDYLVDWVFNHAAEIEARIGATGIMAFKGVVAKSMRDPSAAAETRTGPLVAPGLTAVLHDHFFNYRLDLDVDGTANSFQRDVYRIAGLPAASPRRSVYTVTPEIAQKEGPARGGHLAHRGRAAGGGGHAKLRVINEAKTNAVGNPVGYEIVHANHASLLLDPRDPPAQRAAFLQADVWLTQYDRAERYAAGDYLFASKGVQGLPVWTRKGRTVRNQDVVVWVNMGMHHLPRAEDAPVQPVVWHSFRLRPFNFFDRNPALDLRAEFAK
jgi:primary-amine oxidase